MELESTFIYALHIIDIFAWLASKSSYDLKIFQEMDYQEDVIF